jgi:hypothetical protein
MNYYLIIIVSKLTCHPNVCFYLPYSSLNIILGEKRNTYNVLVGKPEEKRLQGGPRRCWEDNIMMDLRETGWGCMDWIHLAQDRNQVRAPVNTAINLGLPYNVDKFLSREAVCGFSKRTWLHAII